MDLKVVVKRLKVRVETIRRREDGGYDETMTSECGEVGLQLFLTT